jgi:hypothetical protein
MSSLSGEFQTDLGPPDVLTLCVEGLDSLGWEIDSVTERQIRATANGTGPGYGVDLTVDLREAGEGTEFLIAGVDSSDELAEEDLADVLDRARDAIGERIEEAEGPAQDEPASAWAPAPDPVEAETEIAPLPMAESSPPRAGAPKRSDSSTWWDRHRRAVAVGLLVFCLGGAVGAAASGGGDTTTTVKRAAGKGNGAAQKVKTEVSTVTQTQSVEAATAHQAPDSSASPTTSATSSASAGAAPTAGPASPAAPSTPPVAKCDPAYAPQCLDPNVSDYDCQGSGDDGPYYVQGPVTVIGPDHYHLDSSDHDGVGCE